MTTGTLRELWCLQGILFVMFTLEPVGLFKIIYLLCLNSRLIIAIFKDEDTFFIFIF